MENSLSNRRLFALSSMQPFAKLRREIVMNFSPLRSSFLLIMIFAVGFAHAADALLPINTGAYVVSSRKACEGAAFAAVITFDGRSFSGPHDSDCQTIILGQHGLSYSVKTTCRAFGDGTPTVPSTVFQSVRIKSRSAFALTRDNKKIDYALCPKFH
ncbi:hypothetical protein [Rhodanobacter sp. MP7CTX1]|uniref:hypothetical protein n=1 Tax=Rhodanobacter sp. MP7CTX1 TaxID=2723084 RepID=UPI00161EBCC9|nr:hypothetical protein [Rhodanobacter sp. MP7CTX1]